MEAGVPMARHFPGQLDLQRSVFCENGDQCHWLPGLTGLIIDGF